jgi:hypothetical protein
MTFIQTLITDLTYVVIVYLGAHLILTGQGFPSECCLHFCHFVKHSTTFIRKALHPLGQELADDHEGNATSYWQKQSVMRLGRAENQGTVGPTLSGCAQVVGECEELRSSGPLL